MPEDVVFREAIPHDVDSMATIVSRSFASDSFLVSVMPDTPTIQSWWTQSFEKAIEDPAARLLIAVYQSKVVGVFTLHYFDGTPSSTSILSVIPLTPDHAPVMSEALAGLGQNRRTIMENKPHFLVELVAVDREYQGKGIGRRLTQWACDIADETDAAMYLHTTAAADYYTGKVDLGFRELEEDNHKGIIIRQAKSSRSSAPS